MLYSIILTDGNGNIVRTETKAAAFRWVTPTAAANQTEAALRCGETKTANNSIYEHAQIFMDYTPTAAALRVYPLNNSLLAFRCAKTAASVAFNKGGKAAATEHKASKPTWAATKNGGKKAANQTAAAIETASKQTAAARLNATQAAIDSDFRRINAALLAALCDMPQEKQTDDFIESFIFSHIATANAHTQDFFSVCVLAAYENGNATPTEKTAAIYQAANHWIYQNKAASVRETSIEFIMDGGGDMVAFGTAAAAILKGGERWTPTAAADMDVETAAALGETLAAAFATLTPTERKITLFTVNGYSQNQTAAKMGYSNKSTINRKIAGIRKAFAEYITANAPQFVSLVRQTETRQAAAAAKRGHDKTAAERMRKYRERKAAKAAAANAERMKTLRQTWAASENGERLTPTAAIVTEKTAAAFTLDNGNIVPMQGEYIR